MKLNEANFIFKTQELWSQYHSFEQILPIAHWWETDGSLSRLNRHRRRFRRQVMRKKLSSHRSPSHGSGESSDSSEHSTSISSSTNESSLDERQEISLIVSQWYKVSNDPRRSDVSDHPSDDEPWNEPLSDQEESAKWLVPLWRMPDCYKCWYSTILLLW